MNLLELVGCPFRQVFFQQIHTKENSESNRLLNKLSKVRIQVCPRRFPDIGRQVDVPKPWVGFLLPYAEGDRSILRHFFVRRQFCWCRNTVRGKLANWPRAVRSVDVVLQLPF